MEIRKRKRKEINKVFREWAHLTGQNNHNEGNRFTRITADRQRESSTQITRDDAVYIDALDLFYLFISKCRSLLYADHDAVPSPHC
jgi:hypothetical protein